MEHLSAIGAAIATASTLTIQMLLAVWAVWRRLGIMTIPFIPLRLLPKRVVETG